MPHGTDDVKTITPNMSQTWGVINIVKIMYKTVSLPSSIYLFAIELYESDPKERMLPHLGISSKIEFSLIIDKINMIFFCSISYASCTYPHTLQAEVPICDWLMVIPWCVTLSGCRGWLLRCSNYFLYGNIGLFHVDGWWQFPDVFHFLDVEDDCLDILIIF